MTTALIAPKTCRRCSGSGSVPLHRDGGMCYGCSGVGQVETDKATIAAKKDRLTARSALGRAAFAAGHAAHSGLMLLESREPERMEKAIVSFAAGRTDVVPALAAYYEAARA